MSNIWWVAEKALWGQGADSKTNQTTKQFYLGQYEGRKKTSCFLLVQILFNCLVV